MTGTESTPLIGSVRREKSLHLTRDPRAVPDAHGRGKSAGMTILALIVLCLMSSLPSVSSAYPADREECFGRKATMVPLKPGIVYGTSGSDVIISRVKGQRVYGLEGNDFICGARGWQLLRGQDGDDHLDGTFGRSEDV